MKMPRYTLEERLLIVNTHYRNGENFTMTMRRLCEHFGVHNRPSRPAIEHLINKFERTFALKDEISVRCRHLIKSAENITAVRASV